MPSSSGHGIVQVGTSQATDPKPHRNAKSAGNDAKALERQVGSHTAGAASATVGGPATRDHGERPTCPFQQENQKGKTSIKSIVIFALLVFASGIQAHQKMAQEGPAKPHCEMMKRGEKGMGFSQQTTTHHFRLLADGGAIEIETNDPKDNDTRDKIRQHLTHLTKMFSDGNFEIPMFIHDKTPPGVPTMTELRDQIHYDFESMDSGGRVRIRTSNARAVEAVHEFLRFQITEHQTDDPMSPPAHPGK